MKARGETSASHYPSHIANFRSRPCQRVWRGWIRIMTRSRRNLSMDWMDHHPNGFHHNYGHHVSIISPSLFFSALFYSSPFGIELVDSSPCLCLFLACCMLLFVANICRLVSMLLLACGKVFKGGSEKKKTSSNKRGKKKGEKKKEWRDLILWGWMRDRCNGAKGKQRPM